MRSAHAERVNSSRSACCSRPQAPLRVAGKRQWQHKPCWAWPGDDESDGASTSARVPQRMSMPSISATPTLQAAPQRPSRPAPSFDSTPRPGCTPDSITQSRLPAQQHVQTVSATSTAASGATTAASALPAAASAQVPQQANDSLTLEEAVKATTSAAQLQRVLTDHGLDKLSPCELLLFCNQLSRVQKAAATTVRSWSQSQALLEQLLGALDPHMDKLNTYELVVLVAAVARLRHAPSQEWLSRFFTLCEPKLKDCGTGNLTMLARAISSLGLEPWVIKEVPEFRAWWESYSSLSLKKMHAFRSDELIRVLSSLADLHLKPRTEWMHEFNRALKGKLGTMEPPLLARGMLAFSSLQYEPQRPLLKAYYMQLYSRLPMFDDQDLATTAEAFKALRRIVKQDFLGEFLEEVRVKLPTFTPVTLANLLAALGSLARPHRLQYNLSLPPRFETPERLLRALNDHMLKHMWDFSGDCLANTLWGMAMLGHRPSQVFMEKCVAASHGKLHGMRNEQLARMLAVLAICKYQPQGLRAAATLDSWYQEFTKLAGRREYSTREACDLLNMLTSLPEQHRKHVTTYFVSQVMRSTHLTSSTCISATRLAILARSLRSLGYQPDFGTLSSLTQTARFFWTSFRPQEYADLLSAFASFSSTAAIDPLWVTEFLAVIQCRLHQFPPSALSKLLAAVVDFPVVQPGAQWMKLAVARVQQTVSSYSAAQLSSVVLALSRRRYRLSRATFDSFVQHLATHEEEVPPAFRGELSSALLHIMPASLGGSCTSDHYVQLHQRLGAPMVPPVHTSQPQPASAVHLPSPTSHIDSSTRLETLELMSLCSAPVTTHHLVRATNGASHTSSMQALVEKQLVATEGR